jgi:archaetidylinositol phosphate synthase
MLKSRLETESVDRRLLFFSRLGLRPNTWTALALIMAIGGFISLSAHELLAGIILFGLSGLMDMVDGAVARATGMVSATGAFIDGVLDRYVEFLLIFGLMVYLGDGLYFAVPLKFWFMLLVFGSVMTSFVRAYADHRGLVKDEKVISGMGGLLERAERLMLLYLGMLGGLINLKWLVMCIVLVAILSNLTVVQRIYLAIKYGKEF